jgi:hypothetical protein
MMNSLQKSPGHDQICNNWFQQDVKRYDLRFMNSLILPAVRKTCLTIGGSLLLYRFTKRAIKLT